MTDAASLTPPGEPTMHSVRAGRIILAIANDDIDQVWQIVEEGSHPVQLIAELASGAAGLLAEKHGKNWQAAFSAAINETDIRLTLASVEED